MKTATTFPWTEEAFAAKVQRAVKAYWAGRKAQAKKQKKAGKKDAGTRGEVTGGQHLNTFAHLVAHR